MINFIHYVFLAHSIIGVLAILVGFLGILAFFVSDNNSDVYREKACNLAKGVFLATLVSSCSFVGFLYTEERGYYICIGLTMYSIFAGLSNIVKKSPWFMNFLWAFLFFIGVLTLNG